MADALPAHLADREQSFDSFFDLDKRAERLDARDPARELRAGGVARLDPDPWIGHRLLEAQADLPEFGSILTIFYFDEVTGP